MTKNDSAKLPWKLTANVNRLMYGLLSGLAFYFLFVRGDVEMAMSDLGIALIFDPFRQEVPFSQRPLYQRVWLLVHLSIVFLLLGILLYNFLN